MTYTWSDLFLVIIWAILAFIIQPKFIVWRLSVMYKSKSWVEANLKLSHKTLIARLETDFMPVVKDSMDSSISNHLQTFKASVFRPIQAQAEAMNGEIEGTMDEYVDRIDPFAGLKEEAMQKYLKKYPLLSFIPEMLNAKKGGSSDQISTNSDNRRDF